MFGIADQQQATLFPANIQFLEDPVLLWVGILKLIDHRHRITLADRQRQLFTTGALQCRIQPAEQIVKTQFGTLAFFLLNRKAYFTQRPCHDQVTQGQGFGK
ncbi:hypothetical protein D3C76_1225130 [compost metagenome]